jgi:hypothetical protein
MMPDRFWFFCASFHNGGSPSLQMMPDRVWFLRASFQNGEAPSLQMMPDRVWFLRAFVLMQLQTHINATIRTNSKD